MLTVLFTIALCRRDASSYTVPSRFGCQPCGCGYIVRGLDDESAEQAYAAIRRWMNVRGYRPAGAKRELNLGQMLEIQFPVAQNWFNRESLGSDWNSFLIKPVASWFVFSCRLSAQLQRMDYFSSPRRRLDPTFVLLARWPALAWKRNTARATLLQPCARLLSANPICSSPALRNLQAPGSTWAAPRKVLRLCPEQAVEYSDSVGPEPFKARIDRHESDT